MSVRQDELAVITQAKRLTDYVFQMTENAPKKFRMKLIYRMQNLSLDVIDRLNRANDVYLTKGDRSAYALRSEYQRRAVTDLRLLSYVAGGTEHDEAMHPEKAVRGSFTLDLRVPRHAVQLDELRQKTV